MDIQDKTKLTRANIWKAIDDYKAHTHQSDMLDEITDDFVNNLAEDSVSFKRDLRALFRKSPAWNEELDALVINGTRTHNPDYDRVYELAEAILAPARMAADGETNMKIAHAIRFFARPKIKGDERQEAIDAIQSLAPDAYAPNKKYSRIFKALCDALKVSDDTAGSNFQRQYAQFADEIASRKISFKLYVSLNPAHFLTMSNPKEDKRGDMLISCHSLNSLKFEYNCGCTGYARDEYTFIVFTATNPDDPSTLNNRKNSRQIFAYKPGNGLLLQSRLYDANGGTCGTQTDSKLYRDLVQRELSEMEEAANIWKTYNYYGNHYCTIDAGFGFGGYRDWNFKNFAAKISIRSDHREDFKPFTIGTFGLCIICGGKTSYGLYCDKCRPEDEEDCDHDDDYDEPVCDRCGDSCERVYSVYNENGQCIYVCADCRNDYYTPCAECGEYFPDAVMAETNDGSHVCPTCLGDHYTRCPHCDKYFRDTNLTCVTRHGTEIEVCDSCLDRLYQECQKCGEFFCKEELRDGLCPACSDETERDAA